MKTQKNVITLALVLATLGGTAIAHEKGAGFDRRGAGIERIFEQFDTDGDGAVTQEEIDAAQSARFEAADSDGDGTLSLEEVLAAQEDRRRARQEARAEAMFERLDANEDGVLSAEEAAAVMARAEKMFDRLDADEDGAITLEEVEEARGGHRGRGWWGRGHN